MSALSVLFWTCLLGLGACRPTEKPASDDSTSTDSGGDSAGSAWYPDMDADGYGDALAEPEIAVDQPPNTAANADDCDDTNPDIHPGATELCNGLDDDCDGEIDEGATTAFYPDADGDLYGDASASPVVACEAPDGYTSDDGDCDDANAAINPGAAEICNGIDDDCDGIIDSGGVAVDWYVDEDGDGYGDEVLYTPGCDGSDLVAAGGDCDDTDPLISPGATEICGNGVDEDCDTVDEACDVWGDHSLGEAYAALYAGDDDAQTGWAVASAGDADGDGRTDIWVSSRNGGSGKAGRVYLVSGSVSGSGKLPDMEAATLEGRVAGAYAGQAISGNTDVDGDGYPDVWIGSYKDPTDDGLAAGSAALMLGPYDGDENLGDAEVRWMGVDDQDYAGWSIAASQDLDGDGQLDQVIGAVQRPTGGRQAGSAYIALGDSVGGVRSLSDANMEIYGTTTYEEVGYKVAYLGDTDGDGQQDVGITSIDYADTGALHVMTGLPDDGSYAVTDVCQAISSTTTALGIGEDVAPMGDIDGDGYDDFALGAYGDAEGGKFAGAVYIVKGPPSALSTIEDSFAKWTGTEKYQYASKVSGNADMDGDGNVDLAIGSFPVGIDSLAGTAWIIRGPFEDGHHSLADADAAFTGESLGDAAGSSVAMLADANGDGYSDLVVGAVELDDASGAAYLILGSPF